MADADDVHADARAVDVRVVACHVAAFRAVVWLPEACCLDDARYPDGYPEDVHPVFQVCPACSRCPDGYRYRDGSPEDVRPVYQVYPACSRFRDGFRYPVCSRSLASVPASYLDG